MNKLLLLLVGILVAGSVASVGATTYAQEAEVAQVEATEVDLNEENGIMPIDYVHVNNGVLRNATQLDWAKILYGTQGRYVNFWVENVGNSAIYIDINDKDKKLIEPGASAYAQIDIGTTGSTFCLAKVRTAANDSISINYRVAQRDNN